MFEFLKRLFKKDDKPKFTKDEVKAIREFLSKCPRGIGPLATIEWANANFVRHIEFGNGLNYSDNRLSVKASTGLGFDDTGAIRPSNNLIIDVQYDQTTHKLTYTTIDGTVHEAFEAVPEWS